MLHAFVLLIQASPVMSPDTCPALPGLVLCLLAGMIYSTNLSAGQVLPHTWWSTMRRHVTCAQLGSATFPGNARAGSALRDFALRRAGQAPREAPRVPGVSSGYARYVGCA